MDANLNPEESDSSFLHEAMESQSARCMPPGSSLPETTWSQSSLDNGATVGKSR